ncbi:YsnF/AvaK domain-containing protein [Pontibacter sp. CAU 1760]
MNDNKDKIQSEFEEKLRESELAKSSLPSNSTLSTEAQNLTQPLTIPVIEEQVKVDKHVIATGSVHVSKDVHEENVIIDEPMVHEEADVERVTINQYIDEAPPAIRKEGDVTIIPVLQEEVVVMKRLKLVEEIRITKRKIESHQPQQMTLRKEEVIVKRSGHEGLDQPES